MENERRVSTRHKTLKSGRIIFENRCFVECVIRNLSQDGAKLQIEPLLAVPETFTLIFLDGTKRRCQVKWRKGIHVGVQFLHWLSKVPDK